MSSHDSPNYISGLKAGADYTALTALTGKIALGLDADGDVTVAGANEAIFIGFLQNLPNDQEDAEIAGFAGGSEAIAAGVIDDGEFLKTDANGHLLAIGAYEQAYAVAIALVSAVDNDVFRVFVLPPGYLVTGASGTQPVWARFTATLAEVNAGSTLIPAVTDRKVYIHNFVAMPNGSFAAGTAIVLEDVTTGTDFISLAQAQLSDNAILAFGETGVTLGAALGDGGAAGEGVQVVKTGSDFTTATDIAFNLLFSYV